LDGKYDIIPEKWPTLAMIYISIKI